MSMGPLNSDRQADCRTYFVGSKYLPHFALHVKALLVMSWDGRP